MGMGGYGWLWVVIRSWPHRWPKQFFGVAMGGSVLVMSGSGLVMGGFVWLSVVTGWLWVVLGWL